MGAETGIQWTTHTWNPWRGCVKISEGCANCYAETLSHRNPKVLGVWGPSGARVIAAESYWRLPHAWNRAAEKAGERRRVFCASLADVFEQRDDLVEPRERMWQTIRETPHLDWLLLTKRPEAWRRCWPQVVSEDDGSLGRGGVSWERFPNVWMGTSVENQARADERIPKLLEIPAAVRFLSVEPLLGPIVPPSLAGINWVIIGGESGPNARPCNIAWIRSIKEQCQDAYVPVFVKQWGSKPFWRDERGQEWPIHLKDSHGGDWDEWPDEFKVREFPQ